MKNFSIYLLAIVMALATSCSNPEPEATPEVTASVDNNARKSAQKAISAPVTGSINGQTFSGVYRITKFMQVQGKVYAVGSLADLQGVPANVSTKLSGKEFKMQLIEANGIDITNPQQASRAFSIQMVSAQQVTCDILNLVLGPLDLNLLGLEVFLDTVVLDIVANPAGGLLGQLLCAVANLLSGGLLLGELLEFISNLNAIIDFIGTL